MARQEYKPDQSIHSMTTRQLRKYIADQVEEAEKRLKSIEGEETTKAFREAYYGITYKNGKVKKSTSNASKEEMREMAYALRQFNSLDTESGFAKSIEWKENKKKYETFVKNQIEQGNTYWEKYLTKKGNVSKRGYREYKEYITFLRNIDQIKLQFGYRNIKQYFVEEKNTGKNADTKELAKLLNKVYLDAKGKGYTQEELLQAFENELNELQSKKKSKPVIPKIKTKVKKSKSTVKTKKSGKMREHGSVHERLST